MTAKTLPLGMRISYAARRILLYGVLIVGVILVSFPFLWMVITSFKTYGEAIAVPPTFLPGAWTYRVHIVVRMLSSHPILLGGLTVWLVLGAVIAWRLHKRWWGLAYFLVHGGIFLLAWNLGLFGGSLRWNVLWRETAAALGYQLEPFWANYVEAWQRAPFGRYFINSLIMSTATPLLIIPG